VRYGIGLARMAPIAQRPLSGPGRPMATISSPPPEDPWLLCVGYGHGSGVKSRTDVTSLASRRTSSAVELKSSSYPQMPPSGLALTSLNEPHRRPAAGTPFPVGPLAVHDGRAIIRVAVRAVAFRGGAVVASDRSACGWLVRSPLLGDPHRRSAAGTPLPVGPLAVHDDRAISSSPSAPSLSAASWPLVNQRVEDRFVLRC